MIKHFFETSSVIFWQKSPPAKSSKIVKSGFMQNRKSFAGSVNVYGEQLRSAISESKKSEISKIKVSYLDRVFDCEVKSVQVSSDDCLIKGFNLENFTAWKRNLAFRNKPDRWNKFR